jgi:thiamine biosynthesis protein ThiI
MKEVILCKYGEIVLKGANRATFEAKLARELRARAALYGRFHISYAQSTIYIEPIDDEAIDNIDDTQIMANAVDCVEKSFSKAKWSIAWENILRYIMSEK